MNTKLIIKLLAVFIVVLAISGAGVGYAAYVKLHSIKPEDLLETPKPSASTAPGETPDDNHIYVEYNGEKYMYNENIATLLILGADDQTLTDVMVLCAIDIQTYSVKLIRFPRDTKTFIRHLKEDGSVKKVEENKLNTAFVFGGGLKGHGAENTMYHIWYLLSCGGKYDIPVNRYGGIIMKGIGPLTDAMGGVTVTLDMDVPGVGNKGQTVKLNGTKAEVYIRERHTTGGDYARGSRQLDYLLCMAKQLKANGTDKIVSLYSAVSKYAFTNLSTDMMIAFAKVLANVNLDNISMVQLEGKSSYDYALNRSYIVLDQKKFEQTVIDTFFIKQ